MQKSCSEGTWPRTDPVDWHVFAEGREEGRSEGGGKGRQGRQGRREGREGGKAGRREGGKVGRRAEHQLARKKASVIAQSCPTLGDPMACSLPGSGFLPWAQILAMEFSRQECWSGLPFPSPRDLPDPGVEPRCPIGDRFFTV